MSVLSMEKGHGVSVEQKLRKVFCLCELKSLLRRITQVICIICVSAVKSHTRFLKKKKHHESITVSEEGNKSKTNLTGQMDKKEHFTQMTHQHPGVH